MNEIKKNSFSSYNLSTSFFLHTFCIPSFPPDFFLNVPFECFCPLLDGLSVIFSILPSSLSASARKLYLGSGGGPCPYKKTLVQIEQYY